MSRPTRLSASLLVPALLVASTVTWAAGGGGASGPVEEGAPYEIPGVEIESHDHVPPMIDSRGNLYRVTEDSEAHGNRPQVMKSTDGGVTWVEQDPLHRPSSGDTEGGWALQDGPTIWFVWESTDVRLLRFNTSDHPTAPDTYQFQNEVAAPATDPGHDQYASLAENADDSLWVAYGGGTLGAPHSSVVRRDPQGTYTSRETIDPAAATTAPRLIKGTGDRTYVFYKTADNRIYFRALSANGTLSAPTRVDSGGTNTIPTPLTNVVSYADGRDEVLVVLFAGPDGILRSVDVRNGVPGPEQVVSRTPVTINPGATTNDAAVAHLAVVGTTVIAMWSDAADGDVYSDQRLDGGQWGPDTLRVDTGTGTASDVQYVYLNVMRRSGDRATIGFTYDVGPTVDDDSNIFYQQFTVAGLPTAPGSGPGPGGTTFTAVDPPKGLVPRRSTPLRLQVRDADGRPVDGRTLGVVVRDTVTGDHRRRELTSAGDRTMVPVRGYAHPTRVTVSDAAAGTKGLVLDFLVKPRVSATGARTAPGRYAVHGRIHPASTSSVTLQRRMSDGWVRLERHTSGPSGRVTFTGEPPGTYRLTVPAAGNRVAAHSHRLQLGHGRG
ncbi:hypothetical protein [Nocardioides iriomotensis]|uniref:Uncharacterized protein n=1 Tax=Nocardioides iriomotensis TaxID=715784 RepID=A0A4Q5J7A3_9ACTN|nr:hypothetical protein [Nocardioides iriomotensis]RYU14557.1 hypothetical protein ETU37_03305 [Nocardioides iriomotensis]